MSDLAEWLLAATRPSLLEFIARTIHGLTIRSRAFYSDAEGHERMVECNEAIHRLAGHMARLANAAHELDVGQAESLIANMRLLSSNEIERLIGFC